MGDSLHEIAARPSAGKYFECTSKDPTHNTSTKWSDQTLRIYFQNVNGLRLQDAASDITETFLQMKNIQADIFGFAETQLHCRNPQVQRQLQDSKRRVWDQCKLFTCSSDEDWEAHRKPGGTLLGITGAFAGRVRKQFSDKYGRWTRIELLGRDGRTVTVICAYQVVQEKGQHGERTTYSQQVRLMRLEGVLDPDPRKIFIRDLKALVTALHKDNHDILLMGDFNELIGSKPNEMASVINAGQLTDVYCFRHGIDREQSTYARGTRRVDYILASHRLTAHIRYSGAEPFNFRIFSDHRGLFVDFALPGFFDRAPNVLAKMSTRDLIFDCPRHVKKYLIETSTYMGLHKIPERMEALMAGERNDDEAEAIDRDMTRSMLAAEAKCKSTIRQPWSQALHEVMNHLFVLKRALSQKLTKIDMTVGIALKQSKLSIPIEVPEDLREIQGALRQARRDRRAVVLKGVQAKQNFHSEKIKALQMANPSKEPDKVEKTYRNVLASKELFRRVPSARPFNNNGISMIKVPVDPLADPKAADTVFQSIVEPNEVEQRILQRNRVHFSQAKDTPLAHQNITDLIGFSGTSSIADQLLRGTIDVSNITADKFGRSILTHCRRTNPALSPDISLEEFQSAYKKWHVGTSTSPSGRHLSHQHALFQPHGIDEAEDPITHAIAETSRSDNWQVQHGVVAYAVRYGYVFQRWKQVVNAMIEKEPGNPQLHRLRVIHLYESDYNSLLGIKMRQVIHQAEDLGSINPGMYGSRANRQASDPTFIEVLQYDYAALTRWPAIKFNNDATSCYDRIIPSISNVIARSMGLHKNIAQIHGDMLASAVYRIKTQLGVSLGSYSYSVDSPVFGTGQGSCASPPFWLLNCSKYFDIYDESCFGSTYLDLNGQCPLELGLDGFVDDNSCNANCTPDEEHDLVAKATHDAQLWSDILWSSGGALEHSKCAYHYLQTSFTDTGRPFFRGGKFGKPIVIKDYQGKSTTLEHLCAYMPFKTLGTHQAATHCQKTQFHVLQKKATTLSRVLALSSCSANAAWLFYSSVFMKGIGYPLSVSRLTKAQLHALQGPMVSLTLNRMHFPKRTARVLVYGPRSHGGLELGSLATVQGAGKVILLLRHLRTPGQPHALILVVLNRFQYMAGVSYDIMQDTRSKLPHLEGIWIPSVREYLGEIQGSMQIAGTHIQPLERHGDQYIMDLVLASDQFKPVEVKFVNYCRLYLRVLTISDLCNASGTHLAEGIHAGQYHHYQSYSILQEPLQERPNQAVWGIWRRFLKMICYNKTKLKRPLGPWFARISTRRRWPNYYFPYLKCIRVHEKNQFYVHRLVRHRVFAHDPIELDLDNNEDGFPIPVDITRITDGIRISSYPMDDYAPPDDSIPTNFLDHLKSLPAHEAVLLQHFDLLVGDVATLCTLMADITKVILVSDGGAVHDYGSYGWVLGLDDGTRLARGWGKVFGHDPKSYRAEGYGAKAGALFLWNVFEYCKKQVSTTGGFTFYCDNEGLLKKLIVFRSYENAAQATCLHSEWDIVSAIHTIHNRFPWRPTITHVPSHQDDHHNLADLDLPTLMNIEADALATFALQDGTSQPVVPFDPACGAMLSINGRAITRNIEATLHRHEHMDPIKSYYCKRFGWDPETLASIDWDVYSMVYTKFARTRTFFTKVGWKQLPTGARLHKWTPSFEHRCPSCDQEFETDDHMFQCTHLLRQQWRIKLLRDLTDTFGSFLDPALLTIARIGLQSYFDNSEPDFSERFPVHGTTAPYCDLIDQQTRIGWDHFIRGKISKHWGIKQYSYAKRFQLLDVSKQWQNRLVRFMANSAFRLWEIRNGCRHGIDTATKQAAQQEQAHRELRCLYGLRDQVLPQDRALFHDSVDDHLNDSKSQIRTWITHNQKLILHSSKLAKAQAELRTRPLQKFFHPTCTIKSTITTIRSTASARLQTTRMSFHYPTQAIGRSIVRRQQQRAKLKQYNTPTMDSYYAPALVIISNLPTIDETMPSSTTSPQRRQIQRRKKNVHQLYPDHPG